MRCSDYSVPGTNDECWELVASWPQSPLYAVGKFERWVKYSCIYTVLILGSAVRHAGQLLLDTLSSHAEAGLSDVPQNQELIEYLRWRAPGSSGILTYKAFIIIPLI